MTGQAGSTGTGDGGSLGGMRLSQRLVTALKALRGRWTIAVPVVIGLVLGFLVGGWFDPFHRDDHVSALVPPRPIDLGADGRYVALGDSYAAGEGLAPWQPGTQNTGQKGDRCHRSLNTSYPVDLRFARQPTRIEFRACSGAVAADVYDQVQLHDGRPDGQGMQVEPGILGDDVRLITLTMGGNDVHFANVLNFCFSQDRCQEKSYQGAPTLQEWISAELNTLKGQLLTLYRKLHDDARNARIVVVGYPALFPERAPSIFSPHNEACHLLLNRWDASERDAIRGWGLQLNGIIQEDAHEAQVDYVDVFPYFAGHEPCGQNGSWIRFVGLSVQSSVRDGSFHPTAEGQNQIARIVACYLTVYPTYNNGLSGTQAERFEMTGCVADGTPVSPLASP